MARSPHGAQNKEWGKNRKEEDRLRGLNNTGRKAEIRDQLLTRDEIEEMFDTLDEVL
jgi:hypothetical protein